MNIITILTISLAALAMIACYAVVVEYDTWSKQGCWLDRGWKFRMFTMARTGIRVVQRDDGANVEYVAEYYFIPLPFITVHMLTSTDLESATRAFSIASQQRESAIAAHAARRSRSEEVIMDTRRSSNKS